LTHHFKQPFMRDLMKQKSLYETNYFKSEIQYLRTRIFGEKILRIAQYFIGLSCLEVEFLIKKQLQVRPQSRKLLVILKQEVRFCMCLQSNSACLFLAFTLAFNSILHLKFL
jgi:hypothetical protein